MALQRLIMSAQHIAAQAGGFEPQRQNNGLLFIEGLATFGDIAVTGNSLVTLALESFPFPKQRNDPIEMPYLNQVRKVAGQGMIDDIEVVVRDFVDQPVSTILQNWRNAVYDPITGRIGLARNYKRRAFAHWISPDGSTTRCWQIDGVWPQMVDPGDADMNSPDKVLMNMQLACDRCFPIDAGHLLSGADINWGGTLKYINQVAAAFGGVLGGAGT